jgi:hypothetical protein
LYTKLTNHGYWGNISPNEKRTGIVIFKVKDSTQNLTIRFFYNKGHDSFTQDLSNIPIGPGSASPETQVNNTQAQSNTQPVNVTIHAAFKTMNIRGAQPYSGNIFVVVNMTIENLAHNDTYVFNETTVLINNGNPLTQKFYTHLKNPLYWGTIPPGDKRTGEVVFSVWENTQAFTLRFFNKSGKVVLTQKIGNPAITDYPHSFLPSALLESKNFSYVVENLDTPLKTAQYIEDKYTYKLHLDNCRSYSPEEFFQVMEGDCSDVATFFSYVLAQHGYDAKEVTFKYYQDGEQGHMVTLFTDTDGRMKYVTGPDLTIVREVTSVDDLLTQERSRLGISTIIKYAVHPAGSVDACP